MGYKAIRLAVVGGNRGGTFNKVLKALADRIELTAICDISEETIKTWSQQFPHIKTFTKYEELLASDVCDAVFIATPVKFHFQQSIEALKAGKHVICEVFAVNTINECYQLVECVKQTGLTYMMAENYCFMRPNMMVLNLVQQGLFGEINYAEGAYIHDCRHLRFLLDGKVTWRGEYGVQPSRNGYPTHSLGPVAKWLNIGESNRMTHVSCFATPSQANYHYLKKNYPQHEILKNRNWIQADSTSTMIQTETGALINLRVDTNSARPHNMVHYHLQGTSASYLSPRHDHEDPILWLENLSPTNAQGQAKDWETLWKYSCRYEHPEWQKNLEIAQVSGHGGGDFFVLKEFSDAIHYKRKPFVDVYDAVEWSCIVPLSEESIRKGGAPIPIPNFRV